MTATIGSWNEALLEAVLPQGPSSGQPVVFCCSEESVRHAGARLGLDSEQALGGFIEACRSAWGITQSRGLNGLSADIHGFRTATKPRPVPRWLAVLALAVIAATRMDNDDVAVTSAYYKRLLELLDLHSTGGHPPINGFGLLESLWGELASWLASDLGGRRGLLFLPAHLSRRHVDRPISQTLLRHRDSVVLGSFIERHRANIAAGFDPLRLLRAWGGRHSLTQHARDLLEEEALAPLFRAALRNAAASWDGSVVVDAGARGWPAELRLGASPRRISLAIALPAAAQERELETPDGHRTLPAYPLELEFPLAWLAHLGRGALKLSFEGGRDAVIVPGGQTMLFETSERGMYRVEAARSEPVWVLTCEPAFESETFDDCRYPRGLLPDGWTLLADVSPERLLPRFRSLGRESLPDVALVGGLHLGEQAYLEGFPPTLELRALEGPVDITLDGRHLGLAQPDSAVHLLDMARGTHRVCVGTSMTLEFETVIRGLRRETGSLAWDLGDPPLYRRGATAQGAAGRKPVGPFVRGARILGVSRAKRPSRLLLRTNATVYVVASDGSVNGCARPQPPGWLRRVGLPEGSSLWRVPGGEWAEWLVLVGAKTRRVIRVGKDVVTPTEALADLAVLAAEFTVTDLSGRAGAAASDEWNALCLSCGVVDDDA